LKAVAIRVILGRIPRGAKRESEMRSLFATIAVAAAVSLAAAGAASADPVVGPKVFQFSATCSGIGSVILTNLGPAHANALQVVGANTVVLVPVNDAPGILKRALAAGTTCTFTGAGPPGDIQPLEEPFTTPAVIVNG
jgi:hypothetical protein